MHTFCRSATKVGRVRDLANRKFPNFVNFGPAGSRDSMHQSFTDALVKWLFRQLPMFADSFRLVSVHCVAEDYVQAFCTSVPHRAVVPCDITAFLLTQGPAL